MAISKRERRWSVSAAATALAAAALSGRGLALEPDSLDAFAKARDYAENHSGCFFTGFAFHPELPFGKHSADDLLACQSLCAADANCTAFTYTPYTKVCAFSADGAMRKPLAASVVGGYSSCGGMHGVSFEECASARPGNGFPGLTPATSNAAWSSGYQPRTLECWPADHAGNFRPCNIIHVLEDTATGWPGKCRGLIKQEGVLGVDACKQLCEQDPQCPGWQVGYFEWCYHGVGHDCFAREDFTPAGAQRIQHGDVRKLMDLAGWQIVGLTKQFVDDKGYFQDQTDAIEACRKMCYSSIHCAFWQYAPKYGCWIEDWVKPYGPGYPLTLDYAYRSTDFALDCVAGEMIEHYCPAENALRSVRVSCERRDVRYEPAADSWFHDRVAQNPAECQAECAKTLECAFFEFSGKGRCRLVDKTAVETPVTGQDVASGPRVCPVQADQPFGAADNATARSAEPLFSDEPPADASPRQYFVKFSYIVEDLEYLDLDPSHRSHMSQRYADTLAQEIGVHGNAVMSTPDGPLHSVELGDGPGKSTTIVAYVMNTPSTSWDTKTYEEIAVSPRTVDRLKATTEHCITVGNIAVTGIIIVKAEPAVRIDRPLPMGDSGWARWWPFFLVLLLILIVVFGLACSVGMFRGSARDVDLDSDVEPVGFAGMAYQQTHGSGVPPPSGVEALGKAIRNHLPGQRNGEFTV